MTNGKMPVTLGQAGDSLVKYWKVIGAIAAGVAISSVGGYQLQLHGEAIEKINSKLETDTNETAQWDIIMGSGQDIVGLDTRLRAVEQHISPTSIQEWGAFKASVTRIDENLRVHLRNHGN